MKNLAKLIGIIAFVAVIGFSFAACKDDTAKDDLDGTTWSGTQEGGGMTITYVYTFNSPNVTVTVTMEGQTQTVSGTYSISGSTVTLTMNMGGDTETVTGTLSGNTLTIEGQLVLTKQ